MKSKLKKIVILITLAFLCVTAAIFIRTDNQITQNYSNDNIIFEFEETINNLRLSGVYTNLTINDLLGSSNNWAWAKTQPWCSGSGTELDPYIIESQILNMSMFKDGLKISNSHNKHFIVRNCTFIWDGVTNSIIMTGIFLSNTTNGQIINNTIYHVGKGIHLNQSQTVQIVNNTIYDHPQEGILVENSDYNTITGNSVYNNDDGMYFNESDNNTISGNTANDNIFGIYFQYGCDNNTISGNTANDNNNEGLSMYDGCDSNNITGNTVNNNNWGIFFEENHDNTLSGNTANGNRYGITLYSECSNNTVSGNTANNNGDTGIYLDNYCQYNTVSGNIANNNTDYGIEVYDSDNNTISGNTANNNTVGIHLYNYLCNNTISGNTANNNTEFGISLEDYCENNIISGNTIEDNQDGIFIYVGLNNSIIGNIIRSNARGIHIDEDSDYNEFTENIVRGNTIGININSLNDDNSICHNYFVDNGIHAIDDGTDNKWNCSTIGNFWDNHTGPDTSPQDGIVDSPYTFIGGSSGSMDYLPIAEDGAPRITIQSPSAGRSYGSKSPTLQMVVIDTTPVEMWYSLDGGLHNYTFKYVLLHYYSYTAFVGVVDQSAWDALQEGSVTITFFARDVAGNIAHEQVTVIKELPGEGLDPGMITLIVVISVVGGLAIVGTAYFYLRKRRGSS